MSYRDILARKERQRADGSGPVWPLRPREIGLFTPAALQLTRPATPSTRKEA